MIHQTVTVVFAVMVAAAICRAQTTKPAERVDPKEKELASIPVGLQVTHSPNPAKARVGGPLGYKYVWKFRTTVKSTSGPVTIQEFGAFVWIDGQWVLSNVTGKPFTPQHFAEWYSCPNAELKASQEYSDPNNWGAGVDLVHLKSRWYFIAVNAKGERVKGEAIVEQLPEIAEGSATKEAQTEPVR